MRFDNDTLEAAASLLDKLAGNELYRKAWKAGAKKIRSLKKLTPESEKLTDNAAQISSSSG